MPRKLKIAAVQMDATPAPVASRLQRAADLIAEAADTGAQLVVLPELFNTGYEYADANYHLPEPLTGTTVTWMKQQAVAHQLHLAGTLLLLDNEDVYNTALLIAPDGRTWRYDKQYPFSWERAYFREGKRITVADTDLGKLGMMICWDSAHGELWERYAGKVDALVVMSCPPAYHQINLVFPDGLRVNTKDLGGLWEQVGQLNDMPVFGKDMDARAAWLGVPLVNTTGAGTFRTHLPLPVVSLMPYLAVRPDLWERIEHADQVQLESGYPHETKIVDANGQVLARVSEDGDHFTLAEVELADDMPLPGSPLPKVPLPAPLMAMIDLVGTAMTIPQYRRGVRRQWGKNMAPLDTSTKVWGALAFAALIGGWLLGRFSRGKR